MTDFETYEELWRRAESEGAFVTYYGRTIAGESGFFVPREDEGRPPWIRILRPYYATDDVPSRRRGNGTELTNDELRQEIMTLAHEYGHFQSWLRSKNAGGAARASWKAYDGAAHRRDAVQDRVSSAMSERDGAQVFFTKLRAANQAELSAEDRQRIIDEETTAWTIGREILERLGYEHLDEYDRRADAGPKVYQYRLGMIALDDVPEFARGAPA